MHSANNIFQEILPSHALSISDYKQAQLLHSTDINIVMIQRELTEQICEQFSRLNHDSFADIHFRCTLSNYNILLKEFLSTNYRTSPIYKTLLHECEYLLELFYSVTASARATFSLYRSQNSLCTRYHVDMYDIRLLCTYTGKGTEWVDNSTVNRSMLGQSKDNAEIIKPNTIPFFVPLGVPVFLKGEKKGKNYGNGIVHKSPDNTLYSEPRIIIRIDANGMR